MFTNKPVIWSTLDKKQTIDKKTQFFLLNYLIYIWLLYSYQQYGLELRYPQFALTKFRFSYLNLKKRLWFLGLADPYHQCRRGLQYHKTYFGFSPDFRGFSHETKTMYIKSCSIFFLIISQINHNVFWNHMIKL